MPSIAQFTENTEAEEIITSVRLFDGGLGFLIKWKGLDKNSTIEADEVKKKWPLLVIKYYEKILGIKSN